MKGGRRALAWRAVAAMAVAAVALVLLPAGDPAAAVTPPVHPPVIDGDWADPHVVRDTASGEWISFATNFTVFGVRFNVPVRQSRDLLDWSDFVGDALPTLPAWATPGRTWAPGVASVQGVWTLYFTAQHTASGRQCIGVATASAPTGPYTAVGDAPLVCQVDRGGSIDASPTFDQATGRWWLQWKSDENAPGVSDPQPRLWAARLSPDGTTLDSVPSELLRLQAPNDEPSIEGPEMVAVGGSYWLFYSAGAYESADYHEQVVRCSGPAGPCTPPADPTDPFLGAGAGVPGTGGAAVVALDGGGWALAFNGWRAAVGYAAGGYRAMFLERITFDGTGGAPRLRPDLTLTTPPYGHDGGAGRIPGSQPCAPEQQGCGGSTPRPGLPDVVPMGHVDVAARRPGGVVVDGWAIDPDTTAAVQVQLWEGTTLLASGAATGARPDVGGAFPGFGDDHGFRLSVDVAIGTHTVCGVAVDVEVATHTSIGCLVVAVSGDPFGNLEQVVRADGVTTLVGWVIDPDVVGPVEVQVWDDRGLIGWGHADVPRPDVAAAYPPYGPAHGFAVPLDAGGGTRRVCLVAVNLGPGTHQVLACGVVTT